MELKKGTLLQEGKYEILQKLGQGSFGITYLATAHFKTQGALGEMKVNVKVAIKEFFMEDLNSRKADGSTVEGSTGSIFTNYRKKFRKEAENLSKLDNPNIVKVYDVFDENGTTYYSMEYVDGGNLDDYITSHNPLDEDDAIDIISKICHALASMHDRHMLHLDLKPKNVMRSSSGAIYLIDFGLSKQFTETGEPESSTNIGQGTPGYAPLEQAKLIADGTFPATLDIYALGAMMYKILTGERPADASDILNEGFSNSALLRQKRSRELISVVEKCMSPMKKDRFQSVISLMESFPKFKIVKGNFNYDNDVCKTYFNNIFENTEIEKGKSCIEDDECENAYLKSGFQLNTTSNTYIIDKLIAKGGFQFSYLCHIANQSTSKYVIKEFFLQDYCLRKKDGILIGSPSGDLYEKYLSQFKETAHVFKQLSDHPNLEKYVDDFSANGTHYIVSKYIQGITLSDLQRHSSDVFTECEVLNIAKQICSSLGWIHSRGYLHLDVKPENIIKESDNKYILLIGLGLSRHYSRNETFENITGFTPNYSSIEQQNGGLDLSATADIYSLGATMYKLLTGEIPAQATDLLQNGFSQMERKLKETGVSLALIRIIKIAMNVSVKNRYQSTESLVKALKSVNPIRKVQSKIKMQEVPTLKSISPQKEIREQGDSNKKFPTELKQIPMESVKDATGSDGRMLLVVVHILMVGIMLSCFLFEHVYRGCMNNSYGEYPNTFIQTVSQAISRGRNLYQPYSSIALLIIGVYMLLQITWNKRTKIIISFIGALIIGGASFICDLFGGCNYDNMIWVLFLILSIFSSWCITMASKES